EVGREVGGVLLQGGAAPVAIRLAHLVEPVVLESGQPSDQGDEQRRDDEPPRERCRPHESESSTQVFGQFRLNKLLALAPAAAHQPSGDSRRLSSRSWTDRLLR